MSTHASFLHCSSRAAATSSSRQAMPPTSATNTPATKTSYSWKAITTRGGRGTSWTACPSSSTPGSACRPGSPRRCWAWAVQGRAWVPLRPRRFGAASNMAATLLALLSATRRRQQESTAATARGSASTSSRSSRRPSWRRWPAWAPQAAARPATAPGRRPAAWWPARRARRRAPCRTAGPLRWRYLLSDAFVTAIVNTSGSLELRMTGRFQVCAGPRLSLQASRLPLGAKSRQCV
mmetsp:Transcript_68025/g.208506  ORF Transcript_68025/g.208506 Transcript_68025/m.208506 type:complete len:236 (+) Transcript_68025:811-1518(+)